VDPHPSVPEFLLSLEYVRMLTCEMARNAADVPDTDSPPELAPAWEHPDEPASSSGVSDRERQESSALSPTVTAREVVATTRDAQTKAAT